MRRFFPLKVLLLAGCASPEVVTEYVTVVQEVKVPVAMPCNVEMPAPVERNTDMLRASDSAFDKVKALLIDRERDMANDAQLRALLAACAEN